MPKVTLTITDENKSHFTGLEAFKTTDGKVEVWVGASQEAVATELNAPLAKNRDDIKAEKEAIEGKYKALVSTTTADDQTTAKKIYELEQKAKNPIAEADQKLLDAVKKVKDITPELVEEAITKYPVVQEKLANIETVQSNAEFFKATGYKNEKAFQKAISDKEANPKLEKHYTKTETVDGKEVVKAYADYKDEDGKIKTIPFAEYVEKHADWEVYQPSLTANGNGGGQQWIPGQPANQQTPVVTGQGNLPTNKFLAAAEAGEAAVEKARTAETAKTT